MRTKNNRPITVIEGIKTIFRPRRSEKYPIAGWANMPTTCAIDRYIATVNAEYAKSSRRYTGRKIMIAACPMLRNAVTATKIASLLFLNNDAIDLK